MREQEAEKDLLKNNNRRKKVASARRLRPARPKLSKSRIAVKSFLYFTGVVFVYYGLTWAMKPHCEAWLAARDVPLLEKQRAEAAKTRDDLRWQIRFAQSENGPKSLSRDYGYVEPGEVPIVLIGDQKPKPEVTQPEPPEISLFDKFMFGLCRICRAGPEIVEAGENARSKP